MDENRETLRTLLKEHHQQYYHKYRSADTVVRGSSGLFILMTGWILVSDKLLPFEAKWLISGFVPLVALIGCVSTYICALNATRVAKVIVKINTALQLYEDNIYLPNDSIYPTEWKSFGTRNRWGIFANCIQIMGSSAFCLIVVWLK